MSPTTYRVLTVCAIMSIAHVVRPVAKPVVRTGWRAVAFSQPVVALVAHAINGAQIFDIFARSQILPDAPVVVVGADGARITRSARIVV